MMFRGVEIEIETLIETRGDEKVLKRTEVEEMILVKTSDDEEKLLDIEMILIEIEYEKEYERR